MACRHINTAADTLFYDVGVLWLRLYTRGISVTTSINQPEAVASNGLAAYAAAANILNLSAAASPEGAILLVDARRPPFVRKFDDVQEFLANGQTFPGQGDEQGSGAAQREIQTITVTGVGSSALGAVAFGWNVSEALRQPIAAIVPGYGVADLIPQALGGWLAFGMHDFLRRFVYQAPRPNSPG